jgi:acetyltransferase-like isoleucine patch superfamily enzyme
VPWFIPPESDDYPGGDRMVEDVPNRLGSYYRSVRGDNVYLLTDGSFTGIPQRPADNVDRVFFSGRRNYVTDVEADALVAAGFTVLPGLLEFGSRYSHLGSGAVLR